MLATAPRVASAETPSIPWPGQAPIAETVAPASDEGSDALSEAESASTAWLEDAVGRGEIAPGTLDALRDHGLQPGRVIVARSHGGGVRLLAGMLIRIPGPRSSSDDPAERAAAFVLAHGELFRWAAAGEELELIRSDPLPGGGVSVRLRQIHDGYRVVDAEMVLHLHPDGSCSYFGGFYLPELPVATPPSLDEDAAFDVLDRAFDGLIVDGAAELIFLDPTTQGAPGGPTLAWELRVRVAEPEGLVTAYVDAYSGAVYGLRDEPRRAMNRELWDADGATLGSLPGGTLLYRDSPL